MGLNKYLILGLLLTIAILAPPILIRQPLYISIPVGLLGLGWIVVGSLYLVGKLPRRSE